MKQSRTIVVTGATSGIGRAVVRAFSAAPGTKVFPIGRTPSKLRALVSKLPAERLAGSAILDLSSAADVVTLAEKLAAELHRVDLLVHSGGLYDWTELGSTDSAHFDALFHTNVRGPYLLTQGLLPALQRAKGLVLFINSSIVRGFGQGVGIFKATQHAMQGMTDSLRQDLNGRGVRVSTLYPGQVATPRTKQIYKRRGQEYRPAVLLRPDDLAQLIVSMSRLPRLVEITDLHVRASIPY